jgi:hypothetical protein
MEVVITDWSLSSYLDLKHARIFSEQEYHLILRPDAELLKQGWPPLDPKLSSSKFWSPATALDGRTIKHGFKMKWHNIGNGKVQLRLAVVMLNGKFYLCQGYVKVDSKVDRRQMAILKNRINDIASGTYFYRGLL